MSVELEGAVVSGTAVATGSEQNEPEKIIHCQQPNGCEGVKLLSEEELEAPAHCRICAVMLCDMCAAWLERIPSEALGEPAGEICSAVLCSEHFNEAWVSQHDWDLHYGNTA